MHIYIPHKILSQDLLSNKQFSYRLLFVLLWDFYWIVTTVWVDKQIYTVCAKEPPSVNQISPPNTNYPSINCTDPIKECIEWNWIIYSQKVEHFFHFQKVKAFYIFQIIISFSSFPCRKRKNSICLKCSNTKRTLAHNIWFNLPTHQ